MSRPILHELGFLVTFMGWLAVGFYVLGGIAIGVAAVYAGWWVVR